MLNNFKFLIVVATCCFFATTIAFDSHERHLEKIGFGSCSKNRYGLDYWNTIIDQSPNAFFWMGDIVYGKTKHGTSLAEVEMNYKRTKNSNIYQKFLSSNSLPIVEGVYDDHDFGQNDGDRHALTHIKKNSQKLLLDFLDVPKDSPRRFRDGAYSSHLYGYTDNNDNNNNKFANIMTIFLDTRRHRDHTPIASIAWIEIPFTAYIGSFLRWFSQILGLNRSYSIKTEMKTKLTDEKHETKANENDNNSNNNNNQMTERRRADVLGDEQWNWLENDVFSDNNILSQTDLIIIISSIQVFTSNSYFESWGHFPYAKEKLLKLLNNKLIENSNFDGNIIFLSGDVHHSEFISGNKEYGPLEVTSSGLTHGMGSGKLKTMAAQFITETFGKYHRLSPENVYYGKNFGMLTVIPPKMDGNDKAFQFKIEILDAVDGTVHLTETIGTGSHSKDKKLLKNIISNELNDENRLFMTKVFPFYGFEIIIPLSLLLTCLFLCGKLVWKDTIFSGQLTEYEKKRLNKHD